LMKNFLYSLNSSTSIVFFLEKIFFTKSKEHGPAITDGAGKEKIEKTAIIRTHLRKITLYLFGNRDIFN
jgi:hypothetical protein